MAKKSINPTDQTSAPPAASPKRRAPAKKSTQALRPGSGQAAAPVDLAGVAGTEPLATAPDTGASAPASDNGGARQQPTYDEIAEAAYYRHLNRGGNEGGEFDDWVEAERELRERRRRT